MLVKNACTRCGHAFLADVTGALTVECPKCRLTMTVEQELPNLPPELSTTEELLEGLPPDRDVPTRFDPAGPPPVFVTRERAIRGFIFAGIFSMLLGGVLGATMAALDFAVPVVAGLILGFTTASACRYGFSGRSVPQTRLVAGSIAVCCVVMGLCAMLVGAWALDRVTSARTEITRADLDAGLDKLLRDRDLTDPTKDAGERILIDEKIGEAERLRQMSDPELEDYLWVQQAKLNQPTLAYGKLRATVAPIVRLGPDANPIYLGRNATMGLAALEALLAIGIALRGVLGPARR